MDDGAQSVVTMTGRFAQEGPYRPKAAALPVQTRDGVTKVDPVHGDAVIRPLRPTQGEALKRRPRFKAIVRHIRARNSAVYFVVRGSNVAPSLGTLHKIRHRTYRATLKWPRRLSPGKHVLTITALGGADFKAEAVRFKVRRQECPPTKAVGLGNVTEL
jgi:putative intracellular protease/amidase